MITEQVTPESTRDAIARLLPGPGPISGGRSGSALLATGFRDLDRQLEGGMAPGELHLVAGEPGAGVSCLLMDIAVAVAAARPVAFVSASTPMHRLWLRLLVGRAQVPFDRFRRGTLTASDDQRIAAARDAIAGLDLTLVSDVTAADEVRSLLGTHAMVVVDDVVSLAGPTAAAIFPTASEVGQLTEQLRRDAVAHDAVLLAGVTLAPELMDYRSDLRPRLSDVTRTVAFGATPTSVLGLYRDDVHDDASPDRGIAELSGLLLPTAAGPPVAKLAFIQPLGRFASLTRPPA